MPATRPLWTPARSPLAVLRHHPLIAFFVLAYGFSWLADIVLLTANPLADSGNLRKVASVIKEGRVVDRARLPGTRVLSVAPPATSGTKAF